MSDDMGNFAAKIQLNEQQCYAERAMNLQISVVHSVHDASICMSRGSSPFPSYASLHDDFETIPV